MNDEPEGCQEAGAGTLEGHHRSRLSPGPEELPQLLTHRTMTMKAKAAVAVYEQAVGSGL
jgi:hypothetical protein